MSPPSSPSMLSSAGPSAEEAIEPAWWKKSPPTASGSRQETPWKDHQRREKAADHISTPLRRGRGIAGDGDHADRQR